MRINCGRASLHLAQGRKLRRDNDGSGAKIGRTPSSCGWEGRVHPTGGFGQRIWTRTKTIWLSPKPLFFSDLKPALVWLRRLVKNIPLVVLPAAVYKQRHAEGGGDCRCRCKRRLGKSVGWSPFSTAVNRGNLSSDRHVEVTSEVDFEAPHGV